MAQATLSDAPGGFAPQHDVREFAATSVPVAGSLGATGTAGPFVPELDRAVWVTLSGVWAGSVQLLRSTDGGTTRLALTYSDGSARAIWTGAVNAPVVDDSCAGATYYLQFTRTSGTLVYEVRQ